MSELSFIQTYYKDLDKWLIDTDAQTRYPNAQRLRDLHSLDAQLFEDLLGVAGPESMIGYAEAILPVTAQIQFYPFPPGFRQLISIERRRDTSTTAVVSVPLDQIIDRVWSKTFYDETTGATILTGHRGLRIDPMPTEDSEWVLIYLRGSGRLHFAQATDVSDRSLTTGIPPIDGGSLVLQEDYYNGMELQVYDARIGSPQVREIVNFHLISETRGIFKIRHPWTPKPEGDIWYEIRPVCPPEYDEIYALDSALRVLTLRGRAEIAQELLKYRRRVWQSCRGYFASNVMDRGPTRLRPPRPEDKIPTGGAPVV